MNLRVLMFLALTIFSFSLFAEDEETDTTEKTTEVISILPDGYLTDTKDNAVYISGSPGTYLGSSDEEGNFVALGGSNGRSAFGRINEDGSVIILYNPADEEK
ncbi:MAG TPA: hypothetical protein DCP55_07470 [Chitinophagaceae bacterium]|nr:hypothetical protein [Pseudomonadota bacterium]HAL95749.1 hypothetical protein [Chitinophagaceae bacterium]